MADLDSASGVQTRGAGSIYGKDIQSGSPLALSAVRLDQVSEVDDAYLPYTASGAQAPRAAQLGRKDGALQMSFVTEEYYMARAYNNQTKLIAWYPAVGSGSAWAVNDGTATVSFAVDGDTDVMVSNLMEGSRDNLFIGAGRTLRFEHLLTRIRVRIYTLDEVVEDVWGGVTEITIAGKAQTCKVQLPTVSSADGVYPTVVTFQGSDALSLIPRDPTDNTLIGTYVDGVMPIPLVEQYEEGNGVGLAGYAMIAPETNALYVTVTTKEKTSNPVKITAPPDGGFKAGNSYTIALGVTATAIIFTSVKINDWETEEEDETIIN